jgi:hypothetical protein
VVPVHHTSSGAIRQRSVRDSGVLAAVPSVLCRFGASCHSRRADQRTLGVTSVTELCVVAHRCTLHAAAHSPLVSSLRCGCVRSDGETPGRRCPRSVLPRRRPLSVLRELSSRCHCRQIGLHPGATQARPRAAPRSIRPLSDAFFSQRMDLISTAKSSLQRTIMT